jgi:dTDP-3,4-didehydro-2,6-dideoxy-alpha-D-glucose 3-reductase
MTMVGVAVWGLGGHACKRILPALKEVENLNIIGICSRSEKVVKEYSNIFSCKGWTDPEKMLSCSNVDVIYIASPIGIHYSMAVRSLKAGKHVWCEKPLTCRFKDTISLIRLAEKNQKMLAEAFMYIHHPQFKKIIDFTNSKNNMLQSIVCRFGIPELDNPGFRNDLNLCGGAFWDVGSYAISAILELFPSETFEVKYSEIRKSSNSEVDTFGRALVKFSNKVVAYLEWGVGIAYKNEIELWSDDESLYTDKIFSKPIDYQVKYTLRDKNGNKSIVNGEKSEQFINMFNSFISIYSSPDKISYEAKKVINRASLMNQILNVASISQNNDL